MRLKKAVMLQPMRENLVWGRLPQDSEVSVGSTVVIEALSCSTVPQNVLVGRVVCPLWGDGWLPVKVVNPATKPVKIRRNAMLIDVFPCVALEDLEIDSASFSAKATRYDQNVGPGVAKAPVTQYRQHILSIANWRT